MKCPNCGADMEYESTVQIFTEPGGPITGVVPAATYVCEECQAEWFWLQNRRGLNCIRQPSTTPVDIPCDNIDKAFRFNAEEPADEGSST